MSAPWKAALLLALLAGSVRGLAPRGDVISFQRAPIPDEVPAHLVSALAQDRQGFLWIGTQMGLVRFDGYQFRTLGEGYVRSLFAAADGRLWIGTFSNGLSLYDPVTETFKRFQHDAKNPASLSHNRVEGLAE